MRVKTKYKVAQNQGKRIEFTLTNIKKFCSGVDASNPFQLSIQYDI